MIQNAFEENNMDKATVYMCRLKGESVMESVGRKRKCLSRKNSQKPRKHMVHTIESFSEQINEAF